MRDNLAKARFFAVFLPVLLFAQASQAKEMPFVTPDDVPRFLDLLRPVAINQSFHLGYLFSGMSVVKKKVTYQFTKDTESCSFSLGDQSNIPTAKDTIGFVSVGAECSSGASGDMDALFSKFTNALKQDDRLLAVVAGPIAPPVDLPQAREMHLAPGLYLGLLVLLVSYYLFRLAADFRTWRNLSGLTLVALPSIIAGATLAGWLLYPTAPGSSHVAGFSALTGSVQHLATLFGSSVTGEGVVGYEWLSRIVAPAVLLLLFSLTLALSRSESRSLGALLVIAFSPVFLRLSSSHAPSLFVLFFAFSALDSYLRYARCKKRVELAGCLVASLLIVYLAGGLLPLPLVLIALVVSYRLREQIGPSGEFAQAKGRWTAFAIGLGFLLFIGGSVAAYLAEQGVAFRFLSLAPANLLANLGLIYPPYLLLFILGCYSLIRKWRLFGLALGGAAILPLLLFSFVESSASAPVLLQNALGLPAFLLLCAAGVHVLIRVMNLSNTWTTAVYFLLAFFAIHYQAIYHGAFERPML